MQMKLRSLAWVLLLAVGCSALAMAQPTNDKHHHHHHRHHHHKKGA